MSVAGESSGEYKNFHCTILSTFLWVWNFLQLNDGIKNIYVCVRLSYQGQCPGRREETEKAGKPGDGWRGKQALISLGETDILSTHNQKGEWELGGQARQIRQPGRALLPWWSSVWDKALPVQGRGFHPWLGNQDATYHAVWPKQKRGQRKMLPGSTLIRDRTEKEGSLGPENSNRKREAAVPV